MRRPFVIAIAVALALSLVTPAAAADPPPEQAEEQVVVERLSPTGESSFEVTTLSPDEVAAAEQSPQVGAVVRRGQQLEAAIEQSVPHVGAPDRWAAGHTGTGEVIVVIDTGVGTDFGGTIVGQACFVGFEEPAQSENYVGKCGPARDKFEAYSSDCFDLGVCGGTSAGDPVQPDTLDNAAARPCEGASQRDCDHGTAVAAVAARSGATSGVAPDASVYAIQVFHGNSADGFDLFLALRHTVDLVDAGLDVAAVNLSVEVDPTVTPCDDPVLEDSIAAYGAVMQDLADRGVLVAVAAGNHSQPNEVSFPACVPEAVAVGATNLADGIAGFSNIGPGLDLFAPGQRSSSEQLTIPIDDNTQWQGTSFSAPHVAGAVALLRDEFPKASADQLRWYLRASGVPIATPHGNVPRLQMRDAVDVLTAGSLFADSDPVTGAPTTVTGDFDGDGLADVLAHVPGSGLDHVAYGKSDDWGFERDHYAIQGSYIPIVGNFRGAAAGPDDIFWYKPGSGPDTLWIGGTDRVFTATSVPVNGTYIPIVGNFDGDGWDDIFWYAPGRAPDTFWYGGSSGFTAVSSQVRGTYRIVVGDFNGDTRDDLFFHGPGSQSDALWRGTAGRGFDTSGLSMNGDYTLVVGNYDGNAADDVFLYQPGGAPDFWWYGGAAVGTVNGGRGGFDQTSASVRGTYQPSVGDLNGDGNDDIIWYAPGPAADALWFVGPGGSYTSASISVRGTYRPLVADFDGDDGDDIVWAQDRSLTTPVWWSYQAGP